MVEGRIQDPVLDAMCGMCSYITNVIARVKFQVHCMQLMTKDTSNLMFPIDFIVAHTLVLRD